MKKRIMVFIGLSLIILSAVFMVFWESQGRDLIMNKKVVVADRDISAGEIMDPNCIKIISIPKDVVISDHISPENIDEYMGKTFKYDLSNNSQISVNSFILEHKELLPNTGLFQIKKDWIYNLSSSVRKGDTIDIYSIDDQGEVKYIGEYYVAFSKDGSGREVTETTGFKEPRILERIHGTSVPADIEIAASLEDFEIINRDISLGKKLIIMQKGVSFYE